MTARRKKPADLAKVVAAKEEAPPVDEAPPAIDEAPRSMADDLRDIASNAGAAPPSERSLVLDGTEKLLALSAEADQHPQGKQGCMIFDPPRALGDLAALLPDGVWRARPDALWRFTVEGGAITRAIRRDMSHLIDETEEVRDLAA